jgi:two-component system, probable response regulator PhcQ
MNPKKLLYVDDETLALKYFERLVGELVPVLTADSVESGIEVLKAHGDDIAILITDQRMPGAYGNELLRYAREHHPRIVRLLTTAYSEIDDAIAAINSGEIYRYITKPWNVDALRADLKNAMELADLKAERDTLLSAKLSVKQGQWLATRIGLLNAVLGCAVRSENVPLEKVSNALHHYLCLVLDCGGARLDIPWAQTDLADWVQADSTRHVMIAHHVQALCKEWSLVSTTPDLQQAQQVLDSAVVQNGFKHIKPLLEDEATAVPDTQCCAALAWLIWSGQPIEMLDVEGVQTPIIRTDVNTVGLSSDWLAADIENLMHAISF